MYTIKGTVKNGVIHPLESAKSPEGKSVMIVVIEEDQEDKSVKYLLDTCVLSEHVEKKTNYQLINWVDDQDELSLFVSILSIAYLLLKLLPN